jgi:hypothetical protein
LPASMCAMMPMLRYCAIGVVRAIVRAFCVEGVRRAYQR